MAHRVAPQAETDLDGIWLYVAKESGRMDVATRLYWVDRQDVLILRVVHERRDLGSLFGK